MDEELKNPKKSHPGKAGRKPSKYPEFMKSFRATPEEQDKFLLLLPDDAREAFVLVYGLLSEYSARDFETE